MMYRSIKIPNDRFSLYIEKIPVCHSHNTRHMVEYKLPYFRINQVKNNFSYKALSIWNSIPTKIKKAESLSIFKKLYISFITEAYCDH